MSTPAAKRRRIYAATHTLSKPFRSPFKSPLKNPAPQDENGASASTQTQSNTPKSSNLSFEHSAKAPFNSPLTTAVSTKPVVSATTSTSTPLRNPRPTKKTFTSPLATAQLNADPDIAPLLKAQRELEKQLREVKEELETAEQARKIEGESRKRNEENGGDGGGGTERGKGKVNGKGSGKGHGKGRKEEELVIDGELLELIEKWKQASRLAAEELFGGVRDRVNRMGGPRAWKEMQKKQMEFQNSWDQEEKTNNDDDDDHKEGKKDVEKRDLYAEYGIDPETENERSQREKGVGDTGELPGQEDEFTMAMMLRTLNVDLDIIGYDREGQRWID